MVPASEILIVLAVLYTVICAKPSEAPSNLKLWAKSRRRRLIDMAAIIAISAMITNWAWLILRIGK